MENNKKPVEQEKVNFSEYVNEVMKRVLETKRERERREQEQCQNHKSENK